MQSSLNQEDVKLVKKKNAESSITCGTTIHFYNKGAYIKNQKNKTHWEATSQESIQTLTLQKTC